MKLNNKGMSIVELVISVALISVVMLFLYRLLADVTFEKDNDFFASRNQSMRAEIIDTIETKLRGNSNKIKTASVSGNKIIFKDATNANAFSLNISSDKKTLSFYSGDMGTILNKWTLKTGTLNEPTCTYENKSDNTFYAYTCSYKVYTTNVNNKKNEAPGISSELANNNNTIDDIIISFVYLP